MNERQGTGLVAPIHLAAEQGKLAVVQYLIENGAKASIADANGWTPLHFCAQGGTPQHAAIASLVIDADADVAVDARTSSSLTPLHIAAQHAESVDLVQMLVRHGANINARDDKGNAPIHWAARKGRVHCAYSLIKCGANASAQNHQGWNALHAAAHEGARSRSVVTLLSKMDAEWGALRGAKTAGGKRPCDICSTSVRADLHTLFDAAHMGDLAAVKTSMAKGDKVSSARILFVAITAADGHLAPQRAHAATGHGANTVDPSEA